jgi:hypothetical protein
MAGINAHARVTTYLVGSLEDGLDDVTLVRVGIAGRDWLFALREGKQVPGTANECEN